jgi:ArsR family transcriptional regulator
MVIDVLHIASTPVNILFMDVLRTVERCCPQLLATPLRKRDAESLARAFKVLGDPARVRLLSLLGARKDLEACVCDLTAPLGLTQPTVSHHLKVLHDVGLLGRERRGAWVFYRLLPERLNVLREALALPQG